MAKATVLTFKTFSFWPDLILPGDIPRQTATLWIVDSAASGWFCHQFSIATMLRSTVCRDVISSFKALYQALYLESLKDSGMLFSSHWLVPPGVTNNWAGSKATGRFPSKAASEEVEDFLLVLELLVEELTQLWLLVLQFQLEEQQFGIESLNQLARQEAHFCIWSTKSLVRCWMASFLSNVNPSWRDLCWPMRSRPMPRTRIWASISLTKLANLPP